MPEFAHSALKSAPLKQYMGCQKVSNVVVEHASFFRLNDHSMSKTANLRKSALRGGRSAAEKNSGFLTEGGRELLAKAHNQKFRHDSKVLPFRLFYSLFSRCFIITCTITTSENQPSKNSRLMGGQSSTEMTFQKYKIKTYKHTGKSSSFVAAKSDEGGPALYPIGPICPVGPISLASLGPCSERPPPFPLASNPPIW
jgi:hypothetical protein